MPLASPYCFRASRAAAFSTSVKGLKDARKALEWDGPATCS